MSKRNRASKLICENKILILDLWETELRAKVKGTLNATQPELCNTLPVFLDLLGAALNENDSTKTATQYSSLGTEHGGERARLTDYTPEKIILEYQVLRIVIFKFLKQHSALDEEVREVITFSLENACMESAKGYFDSFSSGKERFAITLSHDLRNPLSTAKVAAELILRDLKNVEKVASLSSRILNSLNRIDRMIQSLLDASKLKAGEKLPLNISDGELISIIKEVIEEFSGVYGDRFELEAPDRVVGKWDVEGLKRVMENLLSNAVKYGDTSKMISIKVELVFAKAIVSVHNYGSYIPETDRKKLFNLFKQMGQTFQGGRGWGVGLILIKGVMESHGGVVSVISHPETGTTFVIDFPLDATKQSTKLS